MGYEGLIYALIYLAISVAITMSMQQNVNYGQPDATAGKLDTPTADEGSPIPVVFGTVLVKQPNVVWYGDAATTPIKASATTGGKK